MKISPCSSRRERVMKGSQQGLELGTSTATCFAEECPFSSLAPNSHIPASHLAGTFPTSCLACSRLACPEGSFAVKASPPSLFQHQPRYSQASHLS